MSRTAIIAVALATTTSGLRAEVVETTSDRFVTRATASVKAPPLATWLALVKPGEWWNSQHSWSGDAKNMTITPQGVTLTATTYDIAA
jgi:hypothetical protein